MKKQLPTVIFVPGVSATKIFPKPIIKLWKFLTKRKPYATWMDDFAKTIKNKHIIFQWKRTLKKIDEEAQQLKKLISKEEEVILMGKSMGCEIIKKALPSKKVKKVVFIAMPFNKRKVYAENIINIYSRKDIITNFGTRYNEKLPNAKNIELPGFDHHDFNTDRTIIINKKRIRLYSFYRTLLEE